MKTRKVATSDKLLSVEFVDASRQLKNLLQDVALQLSEKKTFFLERYFEIDFSDYSKFVESKFVEFYKLTVGGCVC